MFNKLKIRLSFFLLLPLFLVSSWVNSSEKKFDKLMIEDLQSVKYQVLNKYGPFEWKQEHLNWDLEKEYDQAIESIISGNITCVKDYQKILKKFLFSTKDYHVNTIFFATEFSYYPLSVKGAKGSYYITSINKNFSQNIQNEIISFDSFNSQQLKQALSQIEVGDKLIAINSIPIEEIIENIIKENYFGNNTSTGYSLAEKTLFLRRARMGIDVPKGELVLTLVRKNTSQPYTIKTNWLHISEWVWNRPLDDATELAVSNCKQLSKPFNDASIQQWLAKDFSVAVAKDLLVNPFQNYEEKTIEGSAHKHFKKSVQDFRQKGFLPPLGKILWETAPSQLIYAYLYQNENKKKIGYIYLPSFSYEGQYDAIMHELADIIKYFNKNSSALVFDTTNNTGGNLFFMYAVLALLTDKPLQVPIQREIIIQEDVYNAANFFNQLDLMKSNQNNETFSGYPMSDQLIELIKVYAQTIIRNWEEGKNLSDPLYLVGLDYVQPYPEVHYAKPLMILINELNMSCGDFFPAILQDNQRAILFGERTAGAGGHVKPYTLASRFGVQSFSLTASIAYRNNGQPIENLGVHPDIPYQIGQKDLRTNYSQYIKNVNKEVTKLLK